MRTGGDNRQVLCHDPTPYLGSPQANREKIHEQNTPIFSPRLSSGQAGGGVSREFYASVLASVIANGTLLGSAVCTMQPVQVDVQRDEVSVEVQLASEPAPEPHKAAFLPATGEESALHEERVAERPPSPPVPSSASLQSGHGALINAKPLASQNQPPRYPWLARIRGWEGVVVVGARVEPDGSVSRTWIVTSSSYPMLDAAAETAIHRWRFQAASWLCQFIANDAEIPVRFRLTDAGAAEVR